MDIFISEGEFSFILFLGSLGLFALVVRISYEILKIYWKTGQFGKFMEEHLQVHDKLNKVLYEIKGKLSVILDQTSSGRVTDKSSPLSLTELGIQIANDINADSIVEKNLESIRTKIASPRNAYDLQQQCLEVLNWDEIISEKDIDLIEKTAYKHGIDKTRVLYALEIKTRDRLLPEYGLTEQ